MEIESFMAQIKESEFSQNFSHEHFFLQLFQNKINTESFVKGVLPEELSNYLQLKCLTPFDINLESTELQQFFSSKIFTVPSVHDTEVIISIFFERKKLEQESFGKLNSWLLQYLFALWNSMILNNKPLQPVISVFVFHETDHKTEQVQLVYEKKSPPILNDYFPDIKYFTFGLKEKNISEIKESFDSIFLQQILFVQKFIFSENELLKELPAIFENLEYLLESEKGKEVFTKSVLYIFENTNVESEFFGEKIKNISEEGGKIVMSTIENLLKKGMEQGQKIGFEEGKKIGFQEGYNKRNVESENTENKPITTNTVLHFAISGIEKNYADLVIMDITGISRKLLTKLKLKYAEMGNKIFKWIEENGFNEEEAETAEN